MSEYHKIETLYERDEKTFRLKPELILKNRIYGVLKFWHWTEKIDGTNIRVIWSPFSAQCGHGILTAEQAFCGVCGTKVLGVHPGGVTLGGKTNNAQIHSGLINYLQGTFAVENLQQVFPDALVVLYGEGYGAGIQKGGGDYSLTKKFILFDVAVFNQDRPGWPWWLSDENMRDVASKLGIEAVPDFGDMPLGEATELVRAGFSSRLNGGKARAEGLVGKPLEALFDKKGHRLVVKLKTKDF